MMRNARKTLIAADHTKFHRKSMALFGRIDEISTDQPSLHPLAQRLDEADVELHVAEAAET